MAAKKLDAAGEDGLALNDALAKMLRAFGNVALMLRDSGLKSTPAAACDDDDPFVHWTGLTEIQLSLLVRGLRTGEFRWVYDGTTGTEDKLRGTFAGVVDDDGERTDTSGRMLFEAPADSAELLVAAALRAKSFYVTEGAAQAQFNGNRLDQEAGVDTTESQIPLIHLDASLVSFYWDDMQPGYHPSAGNEWPGGERLTDEWGEIFALRANGEITFVGASGVTAEAYAPAGERLCRQGWLVDDLITPPACTIAAGVVSGRDPPDRAFDFDLDRFAGATRVRILLTFSDSFPVVVACASGPSVTPCQGDTSGFADEASVLAALPSAIDLGGVGQDFTVLEADGSLVRYSEEGTERFPAVTDAVRQFGEHLVLDGAGDLWHDGRPVWFGEDGRSGPVAAASFWYPTAIALEDGSTWFEARVGGMWGDADRASVSEHLPGIVLPGAATEIVGGASLGGAPVDGDIWVWADEDNTHKFDWDLFSPQPDQVLGWE